MKGRGFSLACASLLPPGTCRQGAGALTCHLGFSGHDEALADNAADSCQTAGGVGLDQGRPFKGTWTAGMDSLVAESAVQPEFPATGFSLGKALGKALDGTGRCGRRRLAK